MMKRKVLIASAMLFSAVVFAQKDELKVVEKAVKQGNLTEARTTLQTLDGSIENADDKFKAQYYFLKGKTYYEMSKQGIDVLASYETAGEALKSLISLEESGKKKYTNEANEIKAGLLSDLVKSAIEDNKNGNNDENRAEENKCKNGNPNIHHPLNGKFPRRHYLRIDLNERSTKNTGHFNGSRKDVIYIGDYLDLYMKTFKFGNDVTQVFVL